MQAESDAHVRESMNKFFNAHNARRAAEDKAKDEACQEAQRRAEYLSSDSSSDSDTDSNESMPEKAKSNNSKLAGSSGSVRSVIPPVASSSSRALEKKHVVNFHSHLLREIVLYLQ
eukprot:scaffold31731_cov48-Attheya_sp.AAC.4